MSKKCQKQAEAKRDGVINPQNYNLNIQGYSRLKVTANDQASSGKPLNSWSICKYEKGTEPGVWKGKCSLLLCNTRFYYSMETTRNSVKVKLDKKGIIILRFVTVC